MLRLIAILVVAVLLWMALRAALAAAARLAAPPPPPQQRPANPSTAAVGERLIACSTCGVRIPESRALRGSGAVYCSADCRAGAERAAAG